MSEKTKKCRSCGDPKPITEFHKNGQGQSHKPDCKSCRNSGYSRVSPGERSEMIRMFDEGLSIEAIRKLTQRSCRTISYILTEAGRDTQRHGNPTKDPFVAAKIGQLPPDHPLAEIDRQIMAARANPRGGGANPWPACSSLA